jgi:hypothetical protein
MARTHPQVTTALLLLTACSQLATDPARPDQGVIDSGPFITTDREVYHPEIGWEAIPGGRLPWDTAVVIPPDTIWFVEFTIRVSYANRSREPVYVMAYPGDPLWPMPPRIERLEHDKWTTAYDPPTTLVAQPRRIGPGEGFAYDFRVRAYDPHSAARPQPSWLADGLDGTYRIVFPEYLIRTGEDEGASPAPLMARVSNTFQIAGSLP